MSTAWRYTAMLLAGAVLLLGTGLYTMHKALSGRRDPRELLETRRILEQMGGEAGLAARKARLAEIVARLRQEQVAHVADADAFSRRIEETFAELGLQLTASSDWKPVPKFKLPGAAAFERTFAGIGPFDRLLDALATLESWPDAARVRSLSVSRQGPGKIAFTLEVTVIRSMGTRRAADMSAGRIALIAAGLLIAVCGLVLIVRAFHVADAAAADSAPAPASNDAMRGRGQEPPPPRWQSFLRPDEQARPPRPVVHLARTAPNPFDRLATVGGARAAKPENPGLRLEGISAGAEAVALISGHAVREGGTISGFRVLRIGRSAVTLAGPRGNHLDLALGAGR